MNYVTTHGAALRLALRGLNDHIALISDDFNEGNYWFGGGNEKRAAQVLKNYQDAASTIESDMLPEEERWEEENGYRLGDRFYPAGNAGEEE